METERPQLAVLSFIGTITGDQLVPEKHKKTAMSRRQEIYED